MAVQRDDLAQRDEAVVTSGDEDRELEEWTVRAKSEMLRDVFALDVVIAPGGAAASRPVPK